MVQAVHSGRFFFFSALTLVFVLLSGCGSDSDSSKPSLTIEGATVTEGDESTNVEMLFTVTLSEAAESTLTLSYRTEDGTAEIAEGDYTAVSDQFTIAEGSTSTTVSVVVNGDDDFESNENIDLVVFNAQGIELEQSSYRGSGTITDDDDADPAGYYTGRARVDVNGANTTLAVTAMVYDNRILMFNTDENVLYDITLNTVTLTDYTATANIYVNGDINDTASLSDLALTGTTDEATITGSFTGGSGLGDGSFILSFDEDNNVGAGESTTDFSRIEATGHLNRWKGNLYGYDHLTAADVQETGQFSVSTTGDYTGGDDHGEFCAYYSSTTLLVIPDAAINIFEMSHSIVNPGNTTCVTPYLSTEDNDHTGFASVIDDDDTSDGGNDKLIFAFNNGKIAIFSIMYRP